MAVFQLPFPTFQANLSGVLCTETVDATMPMAVMTSRLAFDFTAPSKLSAKTRPITRLQRLFPLPILPYWSCFAIHKHLRHLKNLKWLLSHGILSHLRFWMITESPVFTVWKYLVGGIYQRGDLKLKSVKIGVQGPFNFLFVILFVHWTREGLLARRSVHTLYG